VDTLIARKRLEEIRTELDRSILVLQGDRIAGGNGADSPHDPADAGTSLSEHGHTETVLASVEGQRGEVLDALLRIDSGTYGVCADCGAPIPEGRLDARPEAARCVRCQSRRDHRR
jgi:DnaK suppressor protein